MSLYSLDLFSNERLLQFNSSETDVSILVGENGSGKSTALNELARFFIFKRKKVIAIANSIHDKFEITDPGFTALRGRAGRRQTKNLFKIALASIKSGDVVRLNYIARILKYIGFESIIGLNIKNLRPYYQDKISESKLSEKNKEEILYLLNLLRDKETIQYINLESNSFYDLKDFPLTRLFTFETQLRKLKVIDHIELHLRKDNNTFSLFKASSGELALISTIAYISTKIENNCAILIDEPENSLHPKWQKEYLTTLVNIFYYYQPKIIAATHSPLIVNGAEIGIKDAEVYKVENSKIKPQKKEPLNVEEVLYRYFDLSTPQNRFLSELLIRWLNVLAEGRISYHQLEEIFLEIGKKSYDPIQQNVISEIIGLAKSISNH